MVEFNEEELRMVEDTFCASCGKDFEDSPQTLTRKKAKDLGIRYKSYLCDACMGYRRDKKDAESFEAYDPTKPFECACGRVDVYGIPIQVRNNRCLDCGTPSCGMCLGANGRGLCMSCFREKYRAEEFGAEFEHDANCDNPNETNCDDCGNALCYDCTGVELFDETWTDEHGRFTNKLELCRKCFDHKEKYGAEEFGAADDWSRCVRCQENEATEGTYESIVCESCAYGEVRAGRGDRIGIVTYTKERCPSCYDEEELWIGDWMRCSECNESFCPNCETGGKQLCEQCFGGGRQGAETFEADTEGSIGSDASWGEIKEEWIEMGETLFPKLRGMVGHRRYDQAHVNHKLGMAYALEQYIFDRADEEEIMTEEEWHDKYDAESFEAEKIKGQTQSNIAAKFFVGFDRKGELVGRGKFKNYTSALKKAKIVEKKEGNSRVVSPQGAALWMSDGKGLFQAGKLTAQAKEFYNAEEMANAYLAAEEEHFGLEVDERDILNPDRTAIEAIRGNRALREDMEDQGIYVGRHPGYYDDSGQWVELGDYQDYSIPSIPLWGQLGLVLGVVGGIAYGARKGWFRK